MDALFILNDLLTFIGGVGIVRAMRPDVGVKDRRACAVWLAFSPTGCCAPAVREAQLVYRRDSWPASSHYGRWLWAGKRFAKAPILIMPADCLPIRVGFGPEFPKQINRCGGKLR